MLLGICYMYSIMSFWSLLLQDSTELEDKPGDAPVAAEAHTQAGTKTVKQVREEVEEVEEVPAPDVAQKIPASDTAVPRGLDTVSPECGGDVPTGAGVVDETGVGEEVNLCPAGDVVLSTAPAPPDPVESARRRVVSLVDVRPQRQVEPMRREPQEEPELPRSMPVIDVERVAGLHGVSLVRGKDVDLRIPKVLPPGVVARVDPEIGAGIHGLARARSTMVDLWDEGMRARATTRVVVSPDARRGQRKPHDTVDLRKNTSS